MTFAESMAVAGDRGKYEAGDLLVIDPTANRRLTFAQQPYSTLAAGIYSTKPGILGSTRKVDEAAPKDEVPLGVVGFVLESPTWRANPDWGQKLGYSKAALSDVNRLAVALKVHNSF